jgi:transcriptional regulator with XRE-family HTH domain
MGVATIGSALVEKRLELGLDKSQAAEVIGMSRTTYSSYEQDSQRPSVDVFPALAEFLGISTEMLLTLYGATCVAAARAALERIVSHQGETDKAAVISETSRPIIDTPSRESAPPIEELTNQKEHASTWSATSPEVLEPEELHESLDSLDTRRDEREVEQPEELHESLEYPDIRADESDVVTPAELHEPLDTRRDESDVVTPAELHEPPDIRADESDVVTPAELHEPPDTRADESVSRDRDANAQDSSIVTSIATESYPPETYSSKMKIENKKKKKKKQKNR